MNVTAGMVVLLSKSDLPRGGRWHALIEKHMLSCALLFFVLALPGHVKFFDPGVVGMVLTGVCGVYIHVQAGSPGGRTMIIAAAIVSASYDFKYRFEPLIL